MVNIFWGVVSIDVFKKYKSQEMDRKVLYFTNMFIDNVLMANKEVDFDSRLNLETTVRNLNDKEIFDQWQKFTKSTVKEDASREVKTLLQLLIKKLTH